MHKLYEYNRRFHSHWQIRMLHDDNEYERNKVTEKKSQRILGEKKDIRVFLKNTKIQSNFYIFYNILKMQIHSR
jgi:hypothetical protein